MFQQGSACYVTAQQANQAQASGLVGSLVQLGGEPFAVNVLDVTDIGITLQLQQVAGTGTVTKTISVTPQPCGLLQAEDALQIGWLIAAAWIGAFCVTFIARYFRSAVDERSDYGNS